jgi:hypothetical protein
VFVCVLHTRPLFLPAIPYSLVLGGRPVYITCERAGTQEEKHTHTHYENIFPMV